MYSIIYVGKKDIKSLLIDKEDILKTLNLNFLKFEKIDDAINIFYTDNIVVSLLIEDSLHGIEDFIKELKNDEIFKYLPIIVLVDHKEKDKILKFYKLNVEAIIENTAEIEEIVLLTINFVKNKINLEEALRELRVSYENNIKKSIQLDILKKFIAQSVWQKIEDLAKGQILSIPEDEENVSVLFASIDIFDNLPESTDPSIIIKMLNSVFIVSTQIIYHNGGDIDKFIGDSFLAIFEKPELALLSGILIVEEIKNLNLLREMNNEPLISIKIGINYGRVIRGSVGGYTRSDHTLIGDTVNTAQRLKSIAPKFEILVSKDFVSNLRINLKDKLEFKKFELKGKSKIIDAALIFEFYERNREIIDELYKYFLEIKKI